MARPVEKSEQRSEIGFNVDICSIFSGSFLIIGLGSPIRRDDQAGLIACDELNNTGLICVRCDYGLEHCLSDIVEKKPRRLVIIDSVLYENGKPGEVIISDDSSLGENLSLITTHNIPVSRVIDYLKTNGVVHQVYIIGIYPKDIEIGLEISFEVRSAIDLLVNKIKECFRRTEERRELGVSR